MAIAAARLDASSDAGGVEEAAGGGCDGGVVMFPGKREVRNVRSVEGRRVGCDSGVRK